MNVIPMNKKDCDLWVSTKHYSRTPSIFWAGFGLEIDGMIEGVCVFGQPSPAIQKHAFKDRDFKLYELSRLVVQTKVKNAASFLVGNALKMLESPCAIVSYADSAHGHAGIIYQATNWMYTGATKSHDNLYKIEGKLVHPMSLRDQGITNPSTWAKENGIKSVKPMPKHRYFFFTGSKFQRKGMIKKLSYSKISKYPKVEKSMYYDGDQIKMKISEKKSSIVQLDLL